MQFTAQMELYRGMVEEYLQQCFTQPNAPYQTLLEAMRYSLLAGGKRIRPILTLEFCRLCGGDVEKALPVACGVEMLHTYSLIHDDLPCMDNDDLRRGKSTNHKVYGECTATLAGDALQAAAFASVLGAGLSDTARAKAAAFLAEAAGYSGICGGQQIDMEWEGRALSEAELMEIHRRKTAALLRGACLMGVAAASGRPEQERAAAEYAEQIGLAFQIRDDVLDVIGDEKTIGKPVGSDVREDKRTFVALYGVDKCLEMVKLHTECAKAALADFGDEAEFLRVLADMLAERMN